MAPRNEEPSEDWQVNYPEIQMRSAHLLRSREWADCTFQFKDKTGAGDSKDSLDAHKLILAMASPVFAAMFYGNVGNTENPVIISDIDLPTFSSLLEYIYTDKVCFPDVGAAISLYKAANKYLLIHLEKMCYDYISLKLHPNNVCLVYEFSCFFEETSLEKMCLEMIRTKTHHVLRGRSFLKADINTVKKIVSMDTLNINSDKDLYDSLLDYVSNYKKDDDAQNLVKQPSQIKKSEKHINYEGDNSRLPGKASHSSTENPQGRQILHGIIEQIRFLSMSPVELAKISESTTVLSEFEIRAIFTNRFHPNSSLPMPDGFSHLREPRHKTSGTIRHTVCNVTSMKIGQEIYSPPCYVRNLTWKFLAKREPGGYLSYYLDCRKGSLSTVSESWSCNAKFELRLLSVNSDTKPKLKSGEHQFSHEQYCGFKEFINWNQLIDPNNYFIIDDSITLEVYFTTEPVEQGFD